MQVDLHYFNGPSARCAHEPVADKPRNRYDLEAARHHAGNGGAVQPGVGQDSERAPLRRGEPPKATTIFGALAGDDRGVET